VILFKMLAGCLRLTMLILILTILTWNLPLQGVHQVQVVRYQVAARVQVADQVQVVQGQAVLRVQAVQACPVVVQVVQVVRVVLHNI